MSFPATAQQAAFMDFVANGTGHGALEARAGCGKTSTILLAVNAVREAHPQKDVLVCAYNKSIEKEISEKLKNAGHTDWKKVQAQTLHGLGFGLLKYAFKLTADNIDEKKVYKIIERFIDGGHERADDFREYQNPIKALVGHAKNAGVGVFPSVAFRDRQTWQGLIDHFDFDTLDSEEDVDKVIDCAKEVYAASLRDTQTIDFDDMILLPLLKNIRVGFPKAIVFVDEAQDLSPVRQALARKFVSPRGGRMFLVGDDRQAIYGFSGADSEAMPNMIRELDAKVFPLTVTWRCPQAVVELAQTIVPDIQAAETAAMGEVKKIFGMPHAFNSKGAVLCRNNKPLISLAYGLLRAKVPCKVEGRAIGEGMIALCNKWKIKTLPALVNKLEIYQEKEIAKAQAKGNDAKVEEIQDRVGAVVEMARAVQREGKQNISDLIELIQSMFADNVTGVLTLCSYHRSKGREWQDVYLLLHSEYCPSKNAKAEWQVQQEHNLAYVAYTRAQATLTFIEQPRQAAA